MSAPLVLLAVLAASASAETTAVLSSESRPYREALEGLRETLPSPGSLTLTEPDATADAEIVVAFGAKAAHAKRAGVRSFIVALAPAYASSGREAACVIVVSPMPEPKALLASLRRLQPEMTRLWIPWISPAFEPYMRGLGKAAKDAGIEVDAGRLDDAASLPARLREKDLKFAAVFIPPDPELVSRGTFDVLKEFVRAKRIPLYAPFPNLVEEGATASIGATFREMGRAAGRAAVGARCGVPSFAERVDVRVSLSAAAAAGLKGDREHYAAFAEVAP